MNDETWRLNTADGVLTHGARSVGLTRKEADLAALLMSRAGSVVPRRTVHHYLFGGHADGRTDKALDVLMHRLRGAIAEGEMPAPILTIHARGFIWQGTAEVSDAAYVVPHQIAAELRRLLATHHNAARAETALHAIFGA
jgi:DNA-binding response OmpR family regulator